jgi:raffinose/stachyose/melibiose transport system substrate-binding protein
MTTRKNRPLTRRNFLKLGGISLTAAGLSPLIQACGGAATPVAPAATQAPVATEPPVPSGETLKWWWWGETEAKGLTNWVDESIAKYKEASGNTIEPTLQDTLVVISEFQTASAANDAPDLQFLWNGIYHMESVWLGYLEPLDDLIPTDLLKQSGATPLSVFEGKQYRLGWYALPMPWLYNKDMFDKAGLNADEPPKTWDQMLDACDKLKSAGFTPIVAGLKDGPWGEWFMGHALGQNLDSPADAINLFIGDLDWRDPKHYEHWAKLEELWKAGFFNDDMNSVELYPGIDLYGAGQGAMTAIVGTLVPAQADMLGVEKVGHMVFPVFGSGAMAGKPIFDAQGLGISSQSQFKEIAADFLQFMHTQERLDALYEQVKILPSDASWDSSVVDKANDTINQEQIAGWITADNVPYISNLMPGLFWTDAMFVNSQKIVAGEWDAEQAGQNAYEVTQKWAEQNPDLVEKYSTWTADFR